MSSGETSSKSTKLWIGIIAVTVLVFAAWLSYQLTGPAAPSDRSSRLDEPVRPPTLDPARFTDRTREAYQTAKEIPEVLEHLPCYCGCMTNSGHQNNLFCFTDDHGAT